MNTLREIGEFVGIPQGSGKVAWLGGLKFSSTNYSFLITRLRVVSLLVTNRERPASMRAIIQALKNLTPITLEAEIVGSQSGEDPFEITIHLKKSGGITWWTYIENRRDGAASGVRYFGGSGDVDYNRLSSGGDFTEKLPQGNWQVVVNRSGISNTGFVPLEKIWPITVYAPPNPKQPPTPHPSPPQSSSGPRISVEVAFSPIDNSWKCTISGSGFDSEENVKINYTSRPTFGDPATGFTLTEANSRGEIEKEMTLFCNGGMKYEFTAEGEKSGKKSNTTGASC